MPISSKKGKAGKSKVVSKIKPKKQVKLKATAKKVVKKTTKPKVAKKVAKPKAVKKVIKKATQKVIKKATVKKEVSKTVYRAPVVKKIASPAKKVISTKPSVLKTIKAVSKGKLTKKSTPAKEQKKNTGTFELGVVLRTGRRPEAIINKNNNEKSNMSDVKSRYSEVELNEFEVLIREKLDKAKKEFNSLKEILSKKNDEGTDNTGGTMKLLEDGADTAEKENFSQLAVRQQKFITQLDNALARIKNGTYGVCIDTGKLIPKERLKAVPHTQHSIEAKLNRR